VEVRPIAHNAPVHPTVRDRFALGSVVQCAGHGPYRPEALKGHDEFRQRYPQAAQPHPEGQAT
jgi:hypothetical protein